MDEYISRKALMRDLSESLIFSVRDGCGEIRGANKVIDRIKAAPTADVVEVRHGYWENRYNEEYKYRCSLCDGGSDLCSDYCPNCGAKMDGKRKDGEQA